MQRAETLFPASARGLTAPSLHAPMRAAPFLGRLTGRVPPLICSLLHLYQHFQYASKPDIETLLTISGYPSLHIRTPSISGSYAAAVQEQGVPLANSACIRGDVSVSPSLIQNALLSPDLAFTLRPGFSIVPFADLDMLLTNKSSNTHNSVVFA